MRLKKKNISYIGVVSVFFIITILFAGCIKDVEEDPLSEEDTTSQEEESDEDSNADLLSFGLIVKQDSLQNGTYLITGKSSIAGYKVAKTTSVTDGGHSYISGTVPNNDSGTIKVTSSYTFYISKASNNYFTIKDITSGYYLCQKDSEDELFFSSNPSEGQYWSFTARANGTWKIVNASTSKILQYNNSNHIFGAYSTIEDTSVFINLFKQDLTPESVNAPESISTVTFTGFDIENNVQRIEYGQYVSFDCATPEVSYYYSYQPFTKDDFINNKKETNQANSVRLFKDGTLYVIAELLGTVSEVASVSYKVDEIKALNTYVMGSNTKKQKFAIYNDYYNVMIRYKFETASKDAGVHFTKVSDTNYLAEKYISYFEPIYVPENGTYKFKRTDEGDGINTSDSYYYLCSTPVGSSYKVDVTDDADDEKAQWILIPFEDGYYIQNYADSKYLEYYSGYAMYKLSESKRKRYLLNFIKEDDITVDLPQTKATWVDTFNTTDTYIIGCKDNDSTVYSISKRPDSNTNSSGVTYSYFETETSDYNSSDKTTLVYNNAQQFKIIPVTNKPGYYYIESGNNYLCCVESMWLTLDGSLGNDTQKAEWKIESVPGVEGKYYIHNDKNNWLEYYDNYKGYTFNGLSDNDVNDMKNYFYFQMMFFKVN